VIRPVRRPFWIPRLGSGASAKCASGWPFSPRGRLQTFLSGRWPRATGLASYLSSRLRWSCGGAVWHLVGTSRSFDPETTAPLRADAEGVDSRVRPFRIFDVRHFMRTYRQPPSCLALPPRPLFSPFGGGGLPPLGHRVLLSACTSSIRVVAGGMIGSRCCLAPNGCERGSTRFPPAIRRRTRPWAALVRSNDCRALAVSPSRV